MFRSRSTYFYLAVAFGLFCYVAFIDKKIPTTKEIELAKTKVFDLNPDDVIGVEITNPHGLFIFQKIDGRWEIRKPVETPADGSAIDGLINQIALAQPQNIIEINGDSADGMDKLKKWDLSPAAERVVIHTLKKQYVLLLGRKIPINNSIYARASERKNEPVRIISSEVKDAIDRDLPAFRSRNVFDFDAQKVTQVSSHVADTTSPAGTTTGPQCEIDLKDGKWMLQLPVVARASGGSVQALIGKIAALHVVDFVVDDASNLSTYGLTSPAVTLSVTAGGEPMVLEIGSAIPDKPGQVYAQRLKSTSVFALNKSDVDDLLKALPNVRDRHILPFDANKVTGIAYSLGPKKGQIRADHALWNTVGLAPGRADIGKANDLLARLGTLETTPLLKDSVTDLKPFGLDKPQGRIVIESPEYKSGLTLLIGKAENKLLYVRNSTEPFVYTVADTAFDFLPADNLALRDGRAINLDRQQVKGMAITSGTATQVSLVRSPGGTWSAPAIKDRMVDSLKTDGQASLFSQLQAKSWLGPVQAAYGLAKPVLTITLAADKTATLRVGATLPDGSHAAQLEGDPTVFALAEGDFGILNSSSLQPIPQVVAPTNAPAVTPPKTNAPASK